MPASVDQSAEGEQIQHAARCDANPLHFIMLRNPAHHRTELLRQHAESVMRRFFRGRGSALLLARERHAAIVRRGDEVLYGPVYGNGGTEIYPLKFSCGVEQKRSVTTLVVYELDQRFIRL